MEAADHGPVHATPAVVAGVVYITGCDENFRGVRLSDGKTLFRIPAGAYTGASPLVDGGKAYFGTFNYEVLAVDRRARKIVWTYRNPDRQLRWEFDAAEAITASPAIAAGRLVIGAQDGRVYCFV